MADSKHPRLILHNFLPLDLCKELEFIHKSCSTIGYRPNVFSTTLSHLIATNSAHLIMPFVHIRERLKEKVEEFFGCEYELFIEFTGLISWSRGASIGWHSDDNRPYLKQREFAAVCYLNSYGVDFNGGLFHFQEGEPTTIIPMAGDTLMYTADGRNIHSVDEVMDGERVTLTLWFSRDGSHDEDAKLISFLTQSPLYSLDCRFDSYLPLPASSNMYWFPPEQVSNYQSGFDICFARVIILGYGLYSSGDKSCFSAVDSSYSFSEILIEPLQLARGDELFDKEFANILHVLQMVQFYCWKFSDLQKSEFKRKPTNVMPISPSQREKIDDLKLVFLKDRQLAETVLCRVNCGNSMQQSFDFDWKGNVGVVTIPYLWTDYDQVKMVYVLVETDSTVAISTILEQDIMNHQLRGIIEDCRCILPKPGFEISHTMCEGNKCADFLANMGADQEGMFVVLEEAPMELNNLILQDFCGVAFERPSRATV